MVAKHTATIRAHTKLNLKNLIPGSILLSKIHLNQKIANHSTSFW